MGGGIGDKPIFRVVRVCPQSSLLWETLPVLRMTSKPKVFILKGGKAKQM